MSARSSVCASMGSRGSMVIVSRLDSVIVELIGSSIRATGSALTHATRPVRVPGDAVAPMVEWMWMECAATGQKFVPKRIHFASNE